MAIVLFAACAPVCVAQQAAPDAPSAVAFTPLSPKQKAQHWVRQTYAPVTYVGVTFSATWRHAFDTPEEYGGGIDAWGKRFGLATVDRQTRMFFGEFLYPVIFRQDPRYFRSEKTTFGARTKHVVRRLVITRNDREGESFNASGLLASLTTAAIKNAYYVDSERGFRDTMVRFSGSMGSTVTINMVREFWPDIKRAFRGKRKNSVKD